MSRCGPLLAGQWLPSLPPAARPPGATASALAVRCPALAPVTPRPGTRPGPAGARQARCVTLGACPDPTRPQDSCARSASTSMARPAGVACRPARRRASSSSRPTPPWPRRPSTWPRCGAGSSACPTSVSTVSSPTPHQLAERLASFWIRGQSLLYVGRTEQEPRWPRGGPLRAPSWVIAAPTRAVTGSRRCRTRPGCASGGPDRCARGVRGRPAGRLQQRRSPRARHAEGKRQAVLPWANLGSHAEAALETGLSGSLLSVEATPAAPSNVRRSDPASVRAAAGTIDGLDGVARNQAPGRRQRHRRSTGGPPRQQPTHLTADGLASLQAELDRLRDVERPQVVERIKHARELGDLRENADYEAARNEQSFLEGRVQELERRLRTAVVIRSETRSSVALGSARAHTRSTGTPGELTIVGSTEADPASGGISAASPVGRALLGHRAGDEVDRDHARRRDPLPDHRGRIGSLAAPSFSEGADGPGADPTSGRACPRSRMSRHAGAPSRPRRRQRVRLGQPAKATVLRRHGDPAHAFAPHGRAAHPHDLAVTDTSPLLPGSRPGRCRSRCVLRDRRQSPRI